jgi:hypothetical protein
MRQSPLLSPERQHAAGGRKQDTAGPLLFRNPAGNAIQKIIHLLMLNLNAFALNAS